jgi:hypothetical protein
MMTLRFEIQKPLDNDQVHTKETILTKLDTAMTDYKRKSYLEILLKSPETSHLLTIVMLEWKKNLLDQEIKIEILKENIRINNCNIGVCKNNLTPDTDEKIECMIKSIKEDTHALDNIQYRYGNSACHIERSSLILNKLKQNVAEKPIINKSLVK